MYSKEEGEAATDKFNGNDLNGRNPTVNVAKPRESRDGGRRFQPAPGVTRARGLLSETGSRALHHHGR
jgi:hypothetical protein